MNILLIEDNQDHRELIEEYCLQAFGDDCDVSSYAKLHLGLEALNKDSIDILLVDLTLPDSPAYETESILKELVTPIPIIVLTSLNDEVLGQKLIKNGAQDFLPKDSLNAALLHRMVNYAIERKRGQYRLEQRAINQQTFCRSLSHDFKAPIRNITQLTSILKGQLTERAALKENECELFSKIDERLATMNRLIDGLYHYILTEELEPPSDTLVDLNVIMAELKELFAGDKKVTIKYSHLPTIKGNDTQIYLLLQNILENGIKFCQREPVIVVSALTQHSSVFAHDLSYHIKICDNGIGIDKAFLKEVFQPFRRLHADSDYAGSGLGLSVVERIMNNHNGKIRVESNLNEGTCITLAFP